MVFNTDRIDYLFNYSMFYQGNDRNDNAVEKFYKR